MTAIIHANTPCPDNFLDRLRLTSTFGALPKGMLVLAINKIVCVWHITQDVPFLCVDSMEIRGLRHAVFKFVSAVTL